MNDSFAAMRAGTDDPFGVVIVAGQRDPSWPGGTRKGSSTGASGSAGSTGISGSQTDISESALTAVAEAFIGLGPPTSSTTMLCEFAGVESVVDLVDGTARGPYHTTLFTPVVMAAAADGDWVARGLLSTRGVMLEATRRPCDPDAPDGAHVISTSCSRATCSTALPELGEAVQLCVLPIRARRTCDAVRQRFSPVIGAALLAVELADATPSSDARSTLADGLASCARHPLTE